MRAFIAATLSVLLPVGALAQAQSEEKCPVQATAAACPSACTTQVASVDEGCCGECPLEMAQELLAAFAKAGTQLASLDESQRATFTQVFTEGCQDCPIGKRYDGAMGFVEAAVGQVNSLHQQMSAAELEGVSDDLRQLLQLRGQVVASLNQVLSAHRAAFAPEGCCDDVKAVAVQADCCPEAACTEATTKVAAKSDCCGTCKTTTVATKSDCCGTCKTTEVAAKSECCDRSKAVAVVSNCGSACASTKVAAQSCATKACPSVTVEIAVKSGCDEVKACGSAVVVATKSCDTACASTRVAAKTCDASACPVVAEPVSAPSSCCATTAAAKDCAGMDKAQLAAAKLQQQCTQACGQAAEKSCCDAVKTVAAEKSCCDAVKTVAAEKSCCDAAKTVAAEKSCCDAVKTVAAKECGDCETECCSEGDGELTLEQFPAHAAGMIRCADYILASWAQVPAEWAALQPEQMVALMKVGEQINSHPAMPTSMAALAYYGETFSKLAELDKVIAEKMAAEFGEPCCVFQSSSDLLAKAGEITRVMNATFAATEGEAAPAEQE